MRLIDFINKYYKNILNIAIIILTLIIAINIYRSQTRTRESLKGKKDTEIKKNAVLSNIRQSEGVLNSYKNLLAQKDVSLVINAINNIAKDSDITIISIRPQGERTYPVYIRYPFDLAISADNYHALGKFISRLENYTDVYIVDSISIKSVVGEDNQMHKLTANLILGAIAFKD